MNHTPDPHHPRHVVKLHELTERGPVYECVTCGRVDARERLQEQCPARVSENEARLTA